MQTIIITLLMLVLGIFTPDFVLSKDIDICPQSKLDFVKINSNDCDKLLDWDIYLRIVSRKLYETTSNNIVNYTKTEGDRATFDKYFEKVMNLDTIILGEGTDRILYSLSQMAEAKINDSSVTETQKFALRKSTDVISSTISIWQKSDKYNKINIKETYNKIAEESVKIASMGYGISLAVDSINDTYTHLATNLALNHYFSSGGKTSKSGAFKKVEYEFDLINKKDEESYNTIKRYLGFDDAKNVYDSVYAMNLFNNYSDYITKLRNIRKKVAIKPEVIISNTSTSVPLGSQVKISFKASQNNSGSGLKEVRLWEKTGVGGWNPRNEKISVTGFAKEGSITIDAKNTGVFQYGLHVVDNANNEVDEKGDPITITVKEPTKILTNNILSDDMAGKHIRNYFVTTDKPADEIKLLFYSDSKRIHSVGKPITLTRSKENQNKWITSSEIELNDIRYWKLSAFIGDHETSSAVGVIKTYPVYTLSGTVRLGGKDGQLLEGVAVKLHDKSFVTKKDGSFQFINLKSDSYTLDISKPGCVGFVTGSYKIPDVQLPINLFLSETPKDKSKDTIYAQCLQRNKGTRSNYYVFTFPADMHKQLGCKNYAGSSNMLLQISTNDNDFEDLTDHENMVMNDVSDKVSKKWAIRLKFGVSGKIYYRFKSLDGKYESQSTFLEIM